MSYVVVLATFLAAAVEWVEALTVVLAVGLFKGWRSAFLGAILAVVLLVALVALFGIAITSHVSIAAARTVVGVFLLLFGLKWLHKAILRSSGLKSLHDEAKTFEETTQNLMRSGPRRTSFDRVGVTTSLGGVFLEGLEVVFIVVALGGLDNVTSAAVGAVLALIVVVAAGVSLRRPLTRVPENTMKYVVGIMLTSFGTFFAGEGMGVAWWRQDLSLIPLIVLYGLVSIAFVWLLSHTWAPAMTRMPTIRAIRAGLTEIWGLFVDDGALAVAALAVLSAVAVFIGHFRHQRELAGVLLVIGIVLAVGIGLAEPLKRARTEPSNAGPERGAEAGSSSVVDGGGAHR